MPWPRTLCISDLLVDPARASRIYAASGGAGVLAVDLVEVVPASSGGAFGLLVAGLMGVVARARRHGRSGRPDGEPRA